MARSHAKVDTAIWIDADWRSLPVVAQWLYVVLLSQSKLNLAGCLDLMPARWATLAEDVNDHDVRTALGDLERGRYVAIDTETGELVVRTFVANDLARGALNSNLVRGFWSAWKGILSADLRHVVIENLPDKVWDASTDLAPAEAERMRRSERSEPETLARLEPEDELRSEPPKPLTFTEAVTEAAATADVLTVAARLLAEREADRRGGDVGNRSGYVRSRVGPIRREHEQAWTAALAADPTLTAEQLAAPKPKAVRSTDPAESIVAAAEVRYEQAELRRRNPCGTCEGVGQVENGGYCSTCADCGGSGVARKVAS